jgi:hypothetical protein
VLYSYLFYCEKLGLLLKDADRQRHESFCFTVNVYVTYSTQMFNFRHVSFSYLNVYALHYFMILGTIFELRPRRLLRLTDSLILIPVYANVLHFLISARAWLIQVSGLWRT